MQTTKKNDAFLSLGVIGFHMAGHLASAGHQVTVYNRPTQKAQTLAHRIWLTLWLCGQCCTDAFAAITGADGLIARLKMIGVAHSWTKVHFCKDKHGQTMQSIDLLPRP